jgi:hypothetical protein
MKTTVRVFWPSPREYEEVPLGEMCWRERREMNALDREGISVSASFDAVVRT